MGGDDVPDSIFKKFGDQGLLGLRYDPEYGGQGGDYFSAIVLEEEMARVGAGGLGMAVAVQTEMATLRSTSSARPSRSGSGWRRRSAAT